MKHILKFAVASALTLSASLSTFAQAAEDVVGAMIAQATTKAVTAQPARPYATHNVSYGRQYGLEQSYDPLDLRASVALVVDQNSWSTLYEKNSRTKLPIASITKLMTAMVSLDARLDMDEPITITEEDANHYRNSRLSVGTTLPRRDVMLLALMSSENRAAYALGRTYPGGLFAFIQAMNAKASMLGMSGANFVDPSGLSPSNQASAMDLAKMVNAASQYKMIRQLSTTDSAMVYTPSGRQLVYHNSNRLISRGMGWNIGMQKTGTLSAAGKCVVIQAFINGSPKIIVLLDSRTADSRVTDAVRIKDWLESGNAPTVSKLDVLGGRSPSL
ncbi:serine hydrolase [Hydromonas duriensis]|uniref:Murein-DD-endopeptidase n=1 Tax=Hydromonas duriensis TaxID=1527608 RepID=A0A4R6YB71_9BURK|nr:serine hydrolase [Hydromonas duriensis]TDR32818.1 murein-DD-endopeptidase [Hydromonas duriensis]